MISTTNHIVYFRNSKDISNIQPGSVELIVTSPAYPMIEMWDEIFGNQNTEIGKALDNCDPLTAFELMHRILDEVWKECERVLCNGGIACINIGDATRTIDNHFRLYSNHSRIISSFLDLGFSNLPNIIWRKQTNAPNKFMGSGMIAPGAYVTLEHEYILIFRKGNKREFGDEEKVLRRKSAYFWEERNHWFSDLWDFKGTSQILTGNGSRERSGAFPFEVPYRLINMFSIMGDTVFDPFLGTGTTSLAAISSGRNSIGYEIDPAFGKTIQETLLIPDNLALINNSIRKRILNHRKFVDKRVKEKGIDNLNHINEWFGFPVMTKQEKDLVLQFVESIQKIDDDHYEAEYVQEAVEDYQGNSMLFSQV